MGTISNIKKPALPIRKLLGSEGIVSHARELVLIFGLYLIYLLLSMVFVGQEAAFNNAQKVISLERSVGILWETDWQQWVLQAGKWPALLANALYIFTYWPVILITALLVYVISRKRYFYYRSVMLISFVIAIIVFMAFPLMPPRFIDGYGFLNTVAAFGPSWYSREETGNYYNLYAAMPSLHLAWTLILGVLFFRVGPLWLKGLGVLYPTSVLYAIIVTGMHYVLDAIAAVALVVLSFAIYETFQNRAFLMQAAHNRVARAKAALQRPPIWDPAYSRVRLYLQKRLRSRLSNLRTPTSGPLTG